MENTEYLKRLKSQLRAMDHNSRQNILTEIKSSIDDDPDSKLEDRFGSVYQLAAKYLEDMPERASWWQRIRAGVKWALLGFGVLFVLIIIVIYCLFSYFSNDSDDFDYGDINAKELSEMKWKTLNTTPNSIEVFQSRLVVYSGDYENVSYFCEREEENSFVFNEVTNALEISQNKCYMRLPAQVTLIEGSQADIVLADLKNDLSIDIWQAQLRLALKAPVTVENELKQCQFDAQNGLDGGVYNLKLSGTWCAVVDYEFESE